MRAPNHLLSVSCQSEFFHFAYLMCSSVSGAKALKKVSAICHIQFQWKVAEHFWNRIKNIWSDRTKIALEKKYLEIKNWQTQFCCLYVKPSGEKTVSRKQRWKNFLLRKQTPPTNTVNWVLRELSQSALGKFVSVGFLVKFTRVIFHINP